VLTENDVVSASCTKLQTLGFEIIQSLDTTKQGIDIIAQKDNLMLYVEAKGETSSKEETKRYGKPFSPSQIESHVSRALLSVSKLLELKQGEAFRVAIALPDNKGHRKLVKQINYTIEKLEIIMIWVKDASTVEIENYY